VSRLALSPLRRAGALALFLSILIREVGFSYHSFAAFTFMFGNRSRRSRSKSRKSGTAALLMWVQKRVNDIDERIHVKVPLF